MTPALKDMFLDARNITFTIGSKMIIHHFSYVFKPGHLYILSGESGCGKTTLLSLLAGYLKPTEGEIIVSDNIKKKDVSFFSESATCFFDMTVGQNLSMFSKDKTFIDQVLTFVGLLDKKAQSTNTLSKGEMARLALARMLLCDSRIMFFDEPTCNLDAMNKQRFFSILRCLCKTKIVIVASHDFSLIQEEDIILKSNEKCCFEQSTSSSHEIAYVQSEAKSPLKNKNDIKRHLSLAERFRFIRNIFLRRIKETLIFLPIFFFLFFVCLGSTSFLSKSGSDIFYENLVSSNINGTVILKYDGDDASVLKGFCGNINGTQDCIAVMSDQPFAMNHSIFSIDDNNDAVIPSTYAREFNLDKGDQFRLMISNTEKVFDVLDIYQYDEIVIDGFLSNLTKEKTIEINTYNQPIIIKEEALEMSAVTNSFDYARTDYFKGKESLNYDNFILECLDQNMYDMITKKKSYDLPYVYFFWISLAFILVASYLYSASMITALKNDFLVFKLTKDSIADLLWTASLGGVLYFVLVGILDLICLFAFSSMVSKAISRFYLLNATISFCVVSPTAIVSFLLLLAYMVLLVNILITILGHLKIYQQINRLE